MEKSHLYGIGSIELIVYIYFPIAGRIELTDDGIPFIDGQSGRGFYELFGSRTISGSQEHRIGRSLETAAPVLVTCFRISDTEDILFLSCIREISGRIDPGRDGERIIRHSASCFGNIDGGSAVI